MRRPRRGPGTNDPPTPSPLPPMPALLLLLLAAAGVRVATAQTSLACDTPQELDSVLAYAKMVCQQQNESFADAVTPLPSSCRAPPCARAVARVSRDCGAFIASSSWYNTTRQVLRRAVASCAAVPPPAKVFTVTNAGSDAPAITSCDGVLTDGGGQYANLWLKGATLDAGPGMKIQLTFRELDLAEGDHVTLFEGKTNAYPLDASNLGGHTLPVSPFVSTGRFMYVQMVTNDAGVATGFAADISCVCANSASWRDSTGAGCAGYGRDKPLFGHCAPNSNAGISAATGAVGLATFEARDACALSCETCEVDPCASSPCSSHGVCTSVATPASSSVPACSTVGDFSRLSEEVTAVCCDEPSETCATGIPSTCNSGCAAVLLPFEHGCTSPGALLAAPGAGWGDVASSIRSAAALCSASAQNSGRHRRRQQQDHDHNDHWSCSCDDGWSGTLCDHDTLADLDPQCALPFETLGGASSWRLISSPEGNHCDRPADPGQSSGGGTSVIYTNLGNKWYHLR